MNETFEIRNQILSDIDNACEICERKFSYDEIIEVLNGDDDVKKQICILKLDSIKTQEHADLLVFHLTNHHGIVREATAQKIYEFILDEGFCDFFKTTEIIEVLLRAVNDVNPNICRLIIACLPALFTNSPDLKLFFLNLLYKRIDIVFEELIKLRRSTWYTKKVFNLYWCLETIAYLSVPFDESLISILDRTCSSREYTIREKSAFIISKISVDGLDTKLVDKLNQFKSILSNDDNFYVKRYMACN